MCWPAWNSASQDHHAATYRTTRSSRASRVDELRRRLHGFDGTQDDEAGQGFLEFTDFHADYLKAHAGGERLPSHWCDNFSDEELLADRWPSVRRCPSRCSCCGSNNHRSGAAGWPRMPRCCRKFQAAAPPEVFTGDGAAAGHPRLFGI